MRKPTRHEASRWVCRGGQETDCSAIGGQCTDWSGRLSGGGVDAGRWPGRARPRARAPWDLYTLAWIAGRTSCSRSKRKQNHSNSGTGEKASSARPDRTWPQPLQGEMLSESRSSSQSRYSRVNLELRGNTLGAVTEVHSEKKSPVSRFGICRSNRLQIKKYFFLNPEFQKQKLVFAKSQQLSA